MPRETVYVLRAAETNRDGDPVGDPARIPLTGCTVFPRLVNDTETGRGEVIRDGWGVKTKAGADVTASDRIEVRGKAYDVDGNVGDFGRKGKLFYVKRLGS